MATRKKRRDDGSGNALARRLNVSRQRVSQLKQAGKLKRRGNGLDVKQSERMHAERLAAQQTSPSRQIRDHYEAKTAKFNYERLLGEWVEIADVQRDAFRIGRQIRDGLLGFPDRLAAMMAAETDERKVHALLDKEVRLLLTHLQTDPIPPAEAST